MQAFVVGLCTFGASYLAGAVLILFYYTSSKFTKVGAAKKQKIDAEYSEGGQRSYVQVLACSAIATVLAVYICFRYGQDSVLRIDSPDARLHTALWCAFVSHYACCTGDTWASELGVLSKSAPRLITSFWTRQVPPGTNGGMSVVGTLASAAGGTCIGLCFWLLSMALSDANDFNSARGQYAMVLVGFLGGLVGSAVDSLMGATLQATYFCTDKKKVVPAHSRKEYPQAVLICGRDILSNEEVNMLSVAVVTALGAWYGPYVFNLFC